MKALLVLLAVAIIGYVRGAGPLLREPNALANAIGYAMHRSRSHDAVIRV